MLARTLIAGFGGQGVLSMGLVLSQAAMVEGKNVTFWPSYGAEVRGGTSNCTVSISDEEIASPVGTSLDNIVALNQPSLVRFQNQASSNGIIFINTSFVSQENARKDIEVVRIDANKMAEEVGDIRCANIVMLGALLKKTGMVNIENVLQAIEVIIAKKPEVVKLNRLALERGYDIN